jgi:hypothetical protein
MEVDEALAQRARVSEYGVNNLIGSALEKLLDDLEGPAVPITAAT